MHYQRWRKTGDLDRHCETCGAALPAVPGLQKYCGPDCRPRCKADGCPEPFRSRDGYCARHKALVRRNGKPEGAYEWTPESDVYECQACGKKYESGSGWNRRFCSGNCQQIWRTYKGDIPSLDFDCAMCGTHFTRDQWGDKHQRRDKKLCDRCRRSKHKRHHSSVGYLAKRDGTDCGICGETVDLALRHPDLMSPSVDHIMPVALGGSNDEDNLQLSHLVCNLTKQARADYRPA